MTDERASATMAVRRSRPVPRLRTGRCDSALSGPCPYRAGRIIPADLLTADGSWPCAWKPEHMVLRGLLDSEERTMVEFTTPGSLRVREPEGQLGRRGHSTTMRGGCDGIR